jgi:hypothetical protein
MNIQQGLERISAVWWGFWGLLAASMMGVAVFAYPAGGRVEVFLLGIGGAVAAYAAHRITCWIVAGFFAPRS